MKTVNDPDSDGLLSELDSLLGIGAPLETTADPTTSPAVEITSPEAAPVQNDVPAASHGEPPAASTVQVQEADAAPVKVMTNPRILVVDDNKDYRDVVHYVLQSKGYEVFIAEDGQEGVLKASQQMPDLIILDFNMPEKNGYEVIQDIRGNDDTRKIPIVMFTGATNRKQLREMDLDISDFLEKPVSNSQLLASVGKILKERGFSLNHDDHSIEQEAVVDPTVAAAPEQQEVSSELQAGIPEITAANSELDVSEPELDVGEPELEAVIPPPFEMAEAANNDAAETLSPGLKDDDDVEMPDGMPNLQDLENRDLEETDDLDFDIEKDDGGHDEEAGLEMMANDSPLVNRVNKILVRAVEMGASDIHIEPQEKQLTVRVRLNGSLNELCTLPLSLSARVVARVKIMSDLVITERRLPQDGQFRAAISGKKTEFRVSTIPSTYGEKIVMRILGGAKIKSSLVELGLSERDAQCSERSLQTPNGLILVTGPTGSGKTTTLYTMLGTVNKPDVNVMTAEDPVEYRLPGITQVHAKPAIGLSFEAILRSFLRQDPDIMLVGEIRDLETAEIAVKASITGHLVLSTLHTNSAAATITRLTHMGLAPFLVAASVKLIVAQRLLRTLCNHCKVNVPLSDDDKRLLGEEASGALEHKFRGEGCRHCHNTGFEGRKPIMEVMPISTPEIRKLILSDASVDDLTAQAIKEGMTTLKQAALAAVSAGETSLTEAMKIILAE